MQPDRTGVFTVAQRRPGGRAPKGIDALLEETSRTYRAAFKPVVLAAGAGALLAHSLVQIIPPTGNIAGLAWLALLTAILVSSQVVIISLVLLVRDGQPVNTDAATAAALRFVPRYFGVVFGLTLVIFGLAATVLGTPLAIFLIVLSARFALFGPAMVMEDLSIADALRRSWRLAQDRWCRTFGAVVAAGLPLAFAAFLWALSSGNALLSLALGTAAWSLAVPFTAIFTLFLFEDYRGLETQPEDYDIFGPRPHDF